MKILQRFFSGETKMQVKELSGEELQARLREVQAELDSSTGDPLEQITERDTILKKLEAFRIQNERDQTAAYQEKRRKHTEEFRRKLMPIAFEVSDLMPRCLWYLSQLQELDKESFEQFGQVWEESNIPHGFAATVLAAIREASQQIEWHFDFIDNPEKKNPLPTPKVTPQLVIQTGATDIYGNRINPDGSPASYRLPDGLAWLPPARSTRSSL